MAVDEGVVRSTVLLVSITAVVAEEEDFGQLEAEAAAEGECFRLWVVVLKVIIHQLHRFLRNKLILDRNARFLSLVVEEFLPMEVRFIAYIFF